MSKKPRAAPARAAQAARGPGRPPYEPTADDRKKVELLAAVGNSQETIALVLDISVPTLTAHFARELAIGAVNANATVAANLYKQAVKDDPKAAAAAIAWLKMRAGWSEFGPMPPPPKEPKAAKLGKKEQADLMARNPDESTTMGQLMAKRGGVH